MLYHGVENKGDVGIYRTFWALLKKDDPMTILLLADTRPLLEANPLLVAGMRDLVYLDDIVFSTGIAEFKEDFIIASGELDMACRITRIDKQFFSMT
jgi:predicted GH43/DUF377 family glycosyl hydrolase